MGDLNFVTNKCSCPAGLNFSSATFLIFINDVVPDIKATIKLSADTSIYLTVNTFENIDKIPNRDLNKIHMWTST